MHDAAAEEAGPGAALSPTEGKISHRRSNTWLSDYSLADSDRTLQQTSPGPSRRGPLSRASSNELSRSGTASEGSRRSRGTNPSPGWESETGRRDRDVNLPRLLSLPIAKRESNQTLLTGSEASQGLFKVDALQVSRLDTMQSTATDRNTMNMQRFFETTRREACTWVREGESLLKHPSEWKRGDAGRHSVVREMRRKPKHLLRRTKQYFFVVRDRHQTRSGHPELQWHLTSKVSPDFSAQAHGKLALTDIHYVTATILQDVQVDTVPLKLQTEFRVVCPGFTLKLEAPSRQSMKLWVVGLLHLSRVSKRRSDRHLRARFDRMLWMSVLEELSLARDERSREVSQAKLAGLLPQEMVLEVVQHLGSRDSGTIELEEFAELMSVHTLKPVLRPWFSLYAERVTLDSGEQDLAISSERWASFLQQEQREAPLRRDPHGDGPFARLHQAQVVRAGGRLYLTETGFAHMMCNPRNSVVDPVRRSRVHQDMSLPLTHYWIASSHNTYLQRDQLFGQSRLEQYIEVLLRGCRCVEIDCWDGEGGEPIVTHGYTATTRLGFQDVVRVCRDYGFVASPYPLILSLEVHCGPRQLKRMGQILNSVLGDQLLRLPESGVASDLISPEAAMYKVIVKGKVPMELRDDHINLQAMGAGSDMQDFPPAADQLRSRPSLLQRCMRALRPPRRRRERKPTKEILDVIGSEIPTEEIPDVIGTEMPTEEIPTEESLSYTTLQRGRSKVDAPFTPQLPNFTPETPTTPASNGGWRMPSAARRRRTGDSWKQVDNTSLQEYAQTLYLVARKLPKSDSPSQRLQPCNIVSFNENKGTKLLRRHPHVKDHHTRHLSRVYPVATRTDSSNYDPMPFWLAGFQMVALNYQSMDLPTVLNEGMFRNENGGSGYILKPDLGQEDCDLEVAVLCAQYLPKPSSTQPVSTPSCSVRLTLSGYPEDCASFETRQVQDNGLNPRWEELYPPLHIAQPGVAVLAFEVIHSKPAANNNWWPLGSYTSATRAPGSVDFSASSSTSIGLGAVGAEGWQQRGSASIGQCTPPGVERDSASLGVGTPSQRAATGSATGSAGCSSGPVESPRLDSQAPDSSFELRRSARGSLCSGGASPSKRSPHDEILAAAAVPLTVLREGIRWLQLHDWSHHPIDRCGLLIEVKLKGPWAEARRCFQSAPPENPGEAEVLSLAPDGREPEPLGARLLLQEVGPMELGVSSQSLSLAGGFSEPLGGATGSASVADALSRWFTFKRSTSSSSLSSHARLGVSDQPGQLQRSCTEGVRSERIASKTFQTTLDTVTEDAAKPTRGRWAAPQRPSLGDLGGDPGKDDEDPLAPLPSEPDEL